MDDALIEGKKVIKNTLFVVFLLALYSCGGGGSNGGGGVTTPASTPTDPNKLFSLSSSRQNITLGTVYSTQLTGSDSNGLTYTGTLAIANRAEEMQNGILVTPSDLILAFTDSNGLTITTTGTSFKDSSSNLISFSLQPLNLTCTPVTPGKIPSPVKIGDFGILSTLNCSDNTTRDGSWRVEDASNGNIFLIVNQTVKDQNQPNVIVSIADVTLTLDGNGKYLAYKSVAQILANNFTLTLQSTGTATGSATT